MQWGLHEVRCHMMGGPAAGFRKSFTIMGFVGLMWKLPDVDKSLSYSGHGKHFCLLNKIQARDLS